MHECIQPTNTPEDTQQPYFSVEMYIGNGGEPTVQQRWHAHIVLYSIFAQVAPAVLSVSRANLPRCTVVGVAARHSGGDEAFAKVNAVAVEG